MRETNRRGSDRLHDLSRPHRLEARLLRQLPEQASRCDQGRQDDLGGAGSGGTRDAGATGVESLHEIEAGGDGAVRQETRCKRRVFFCASVARHKNKQCK